MVGERPAVWTNVRSRPSALTAPASSSTEDRTDTSTAWGTTSSPLDCSSAAQAATSWGDEDHVRALFGDRVANIVSSRRMVTVDRFDTPDAFRDYFKAKYGPTVAAYRGLANEPERVAALDQDLADLARHHDRGTATTVMDWEYLLLTAQRVA